MQNHLWYHARFVEHHNQIELQPKLRVSVCLPVTQRIHNGLYNTHTLKTQNGRFSSLLCPLCLGVPVARMTPVCNSVLLTVFTFGYILQFLWGRK